MVTIFVLNKLSLLMKATVSYQAITCTSDNTRICYGKNNGFTTNDWQEKHIFVYLVDFVRLQILQFLQGHRKKSFIL